MCQGGLETARGVAKAVCACDLVDGNSIARFHHLRVNTTLMVEPDKPVPRVARLELDNDGVLAVVARIVCQANNLSPPVRARRCS